MAPDCKCAFAAAAFHAPFEAMAETGFRSALHRGEIMNRFHKRLPGSRKEPPGMERLVLRRMPLMLLLGTLLPALYALAVYLLAPATAAGTREMLSAQYAVIGVVSFHWMVVMVTSLFCLIVIVMKGHAVVADAYELPDAPYPARDASER
jgi:hypothetical protein